MDNHHNCSCGRRKAEAERNARTMLELRYMMDAERTQPIEITARANPRTPIQRMVSLLRRIVNG